MDIEKIHQRLLSHFGERVILGLTPAEEGIRDPFITVLSGRMDKVCLFLRVESDLAFDFCQSLTAMDTGETLTCVYHLYSYSKHHTVVLKTEVPRAEPHLPSCTDVWPATDWYEREAYDLFGVIFDGHPNLSRLLLPDDWQGHPGRKDWQPTPIYHAVDGPQDHPLQLDIPTTRENPLDLLDTEGAAK